MLDCKFSSTNEFIFSKVIEEMFQIFKPLNSEQKLILFSNLVVSAIITMMLAFFMNPGGDFSILGWIKNHLWSVLPSFINVFVWNHYQIQLTNKNFFFKFIISWVLVLITTIIMKLILLLILVIIVYFVSYGRDIM